MLSLNTSYPYLIKFHDFADNSQEGDEASNGGCKSGPTGHDFPHNSNIYFSFFTMRTGPFPNCGSSSQIECQVRTFIPVLISGAGFQQVGDELLGIPLGNIVGSIWAT
jgi:hypothetical protein